jgi:hypothetical protein
MPAEQWKNSWLRHRFNILKQRLDVFRHVSVAQNLQPSVLNGEPNPLTTQTLANISDRLHVFAFAQ